MKKYLLGLLTGTIIFTGIGVLAANVLASNITYKNTTVDKALDELYTKASRVNVWNNGNPLNLTLYNGCEIKKDNEDDYYLSFDGVDDYAQLDVLPATINWADGITIEFTAKWDALNNYSRIFDFGNGANKANIALANYAQSNKLVFLARYENSETMLFQNHTVDVGLSNKANYKIVITKNGNDYDFNYYLNNESINTTTLSGDLINIERRLNYLGKSHWPEYDGYFNGRIYKLKIDQADGTNIIDIDVNKIYE